MGNQEAERQGPHGGGRHGESQHGRNPGSGSRGVRSKLVSLRGAEGTPVCGLPGMSEDTLSFSQEENRGLEARREVLAHSCTRTGAQI